MKKNMDKPDMPKMKSLYWALKLLDYFDDQHKHRGVTELAELSGMPKSSVSNALDTFEKCGFLRKKSTTGKYALAPKIVCLYHAYSSVNDDVLVYQKECKILSDRLDAIVHVGVLVDHKVVYLTCTYPSRYAQEAVVGRSVPMHCTAVGKAILAYMPEEEQKEVLSQPLVAYTKHTITDPQILSAELNKIREQDYAVENMEFEESLRGVAVPLHYQGLPNTRVNYAISVSMPYTRMPEDTMIDFVKIIRDTHREFYSSQIL